MYRKISFITAVVGSALLVAVPAAWGKIQPFANSSDVVERAVLAQELSSRVGSSVYRDAFERAVAGQVTTNVVPSYRDAFERAALAGTPGDRSHGLNRLYRLGEFATPSPDAFERAAAAGSSGGSDRSIGLNRLHGLGAFVQVPMYDVHDRVVPVSQPLTTPTVGSGRDIEWPQIGVGFGVGILLALVLGMAIRLTRIRQLAH